MIPMIPRRRFLTAPEYLYRQIELMRRERIWRQRGGRYDPTKYWQWWARYYLVWANYWKSEGLPAWAVNSIALAAEYYTYAAEARSYDEHSGNHKEIV